MSESTKSPSIQIGRLGIDRLRSGELLETKVYRTCIVISIIWALSGAGYFLARPQNFLRMWPHELGSLLSGWAAPLAALWVFATVLLQRAQLKAQTLEMEQTSEELLMSVDQLARENTAKRLAQLSRRVMHGVLRAEKILNRVDLYVIKDGQQERAVQLLSAQRSYTALFKANELTRALTMFGRDITAIGGRLEDEWVLHVDCLLLEELCTELSTLSAVSAEILSLLETLGRFNERSVTAADKATQTAGSSAENMAALSDVDTSALVKFQSATMKAHTVLSGILRGLRQFDLPEAVQ
jgi:hypothetical protein